MLLIMEDSKTVSFCGSCHVMTPIVASLQKEGDSLAATHFQRGLVSHEQACFTCHSGYGIWGTLDAKLAGVRHMLKTATHSYTFPIEHRGPFDIDSCLNCHARAATFQAVDAHQDPDTQQALFKREMSCTGVRHVAAPSGRRAERTGVMIRLACLLVPRRARDRGGRRRSARPVRTRSCSRSSACRALGAGVLVYGIRRWREGALSSNPAWNRDST